MMKKIFLRFLLLLLLLPLTLLCACTQAEGPYAKEPYFSSEPFSVSTTVGDFKITCTLEKQIYRSSQMEINKKHPFPLEVRIDYIGDEAGIPTWARSTFSYVYYDVPMDDNEIDVIWTEPSQNYFFGYNTALVEKHDAAYLYRQYGRFEKGNYTVFVRVDFSLDEMSTEKVTANFEIPFIVE